MGFQNDLSDSLNNPGIKLLVNHLTEFAGSEYFFINPKPTQAIALIGFLNNHNAYDVRMNDASVQANTELQTVLLELEKHAWDGPDDSELQKMPAGVFHPFKTKKGIVWVKKVKPTTLNMSAFVLEHAFNGFIERVIFKSMVKDSKNSKRVLYPYQVMQHFVKEQENKKR